MKKIIFSFALLALTSFLTFNVIAQGNKPVMLKFNMTKGSKFKYNIEMNMNMNQTVQEQQTNISNKMNIGYIFEALKDSAGWKILSSTISKVSMDMNAAGQSIQFDSDDPSPDSTGPSAAIAGVLGSMKDGKFTFTINDTGEIGEVRGIEEMMQNAVTNNNLPNDEAAKAGIASAFNEENFKNNLRQTFGVYPGKAVKPGDSWTKTMAVNNNGIVMNMSNTYTLESVKDKNADVKVKSQISSGSGSSVAGVDMNIAGTMDGSMKYDIPTGLPVNGNLDMKMDMKMQAQGQKIPMQMDIKLNITGKKL